MSEFKVRTAIVPDQKVPEGFAEFNHGPHLCVDVPDGGATISCRTSDGKMVTFHFGVGSKDGRPTFVDIQYDNPNRRHPDRPDLPVFNMVGFGPGRGDPFDTRKIDKKMTLSCLLLED